MNDKIANLRASVATLNSRRAELELAQSNLRRAEQLAPSGAISKEDLDVRRQAVKVDEANVEEALQAIYANRASLGLPPEPPPGQDLSACAAGPGSEFFDGPRGAGRVDRERGADSATSRRIGTRRRSRRWPSSTSRTRREISTRSTRR